MSGFMEEEPDLDLDGREIGKSMQILFGMSADDELARLLRDIADEYDSLVDEDKLQFIEDVRDAAF